ncbi:putative AAA-ATPase [Desulfobotulus alkaliphilus]|uniref:Putative AAA-ATPase n=1 Tax=Desulfobotulus alkaliphilus TaxID=622671 RepID=A0A562RVE7_9BACT|nr:AAA family ATPase [Desulfobotulus alkaliphilus]TWI73047.1 putative AAA-ATPase [Desulfobotulus alkaliphilus]
MKYPYGISDFEKIIENNYFYCDRTDKIPLLENAASQLFIRPRRFGKSLLLSMLENYYDVAKKDDFKKLFGRLKIGQNPTPLRNAYFILRWDFSCVDATGGINNIRQSLFDHINVRIENFLKYYSLHGFDIQGVRINNENAIYSMESLIGSVQAHGHTVYLLIDEYDNFANTILMSSADKKEDYEKLVKEEGILRTIFKAVKALTSGTMIDKVFITGVSPVVLSDITSGYNVAKSVYHKPALNDLCGFSEKEVRAEIETIVKTRNSENYVIENLAIGDSVIEDALNTMRTFYNGYLFSTEAHEFIYNPTMCIYFFEEFAGNGKYPKEMLDSNLSTDQAKLSYIASLNGGQQLLLNLMEKEDSVVIKSVQKSFGIEEILFDSSRDRQFLTSFLYYFGILTIAEETPDLETRLKIPNMAVKGLYADKLCNLLLPDSEKRDAGRFAAKKVFQKGDMQPLCDFVEKKYFKVFSNRDYILANELTLKTAFLTLLYNDIIFLMDSESEISRRYSDLTMIIRPDKRYGRVYDVLIEFKFVSLKEAGLSGKEALALSVDELKALSSIREKMKEGTEQVTDYGARLEEKYKNLRLQKFVVTALGFDRVCFEKVGEAPPLPE